MKNKTTMNEKPQAEINTVLVAVTPDSNLSTDGTALDGVSALRGSGIGATLKQSIVTHFNEKHVRLQRQALGMALEVRGLVSVLAIDELDLKNSI